MTDDEFEDVLARAAHGEVLTDAGLSAPLLAAVIRVAAAATPAERRPHLRAARRIHEAATARRTDLSDIPDLPDAMES